ncbi:hypothetical protein TCON_0197 [Astathelohania contejeani]|uniref:Uncharacterized protein n=1 Tax=Astathelohania contejeani TaxID=164912 RepID=A0ABQ7I2H9_9MICR|nr:hypothetical protein TCON_0197 [Thelohania contejeani]
MSIVVWKGLLSYHAHRGLKKSKKHKIQKRVRSISTSGNVEKNKNISSRITSILKFEEKNKTHLSATLKYFKIKYSINDISLKRLKCTQGKLLYNNINKKKLH